MLSFKNCYGTFKRHRAAQKEDNRHQFDYDIYNFEAHKTFRQNSFTSTLTPRFFNQNREKRGDDGSSVGDAFPSSSRRDDGGFNGDFQL